MIIISKYKDSLDQTNPNIWVIWLMIKYGLKILERYNITIISFEIIAVFLFQRYILHSYFKILISYISIK